MSNDNKEPEVCDACGCAAEIGYVIGEGDNVATVSVTATDENQRQQRLEQYLELARSINENVTANVAASESNPEELTAVLQFEFTAEKLIFEMRSRSLNT